MRFLIAGALALVAMATPQTQRTFTGTISDAMCEKGDHSAMRMGPTDAECAKACNEEHDAPYVLFDGKTVYQLSDQKTAARFAAKRVTVAGTLDAKSKKIQVASITAAK